MSYPFGRHTVYFVSGTTQDFGEFREQVKERLIAQSQLNLSAGKDTNLDKLAREISRCDEVIHLVGPALGGGWTEPDEVNDFLRSWHDQIKVSGDRPRRFLQTINSDTLLRSWPRTYWEAYLAVLLGKPLLGVWQVPDNWDRQAWHSTEEGLHHWEILSALAWDRQVLKRSEFTVDRIVSLVFKPRSAMAKDSYQALTLAPRVSPNYVKRPQFEDQICHWLKAIQADSPPTPAPKILSIAGEANIGKTQMVAYCLGASGIQIGGNHGPLRTLYFKCGTDDGLSFQNLILGGAEHLLASHQRDEIRALWPGRADRSACESLIRRWLGMVKNRGFRVLLWSDQSEHCLNENGQIQDSSLGSWLRAWDEFDSVIYLLITTRRKDISLTKKAQRKVIKLDQGLPSGNVMDYLRALAPSAASTHSETDLMAIARSERNVPGRLEAWMRFLARCPDSPPVQSDPNQEALGRLLPDERELLMTVNILNQTAVSSEEVAEILAITPEAAERRFSELELWVDAIQDPASFRVSLHDTLKAALDQLYQDSPMEMRALTKRCADWLTTTKARPEADWSQPEDVQPWVHAAELYLRASMFSNAAEILAMIDLQVPPRTSRLFQFGMSETGRQIRCQLIGKLPPQSRSDWQNCLQLGLAEVRIGTDFARAENALQMARSIAAARGWPVETSLCLHYLALLALRRPGGSWKAAMKLLSRARSTLKQLRHQTPESLGVAGNIAGLTGELSVLHALAAGLKRKDRLRRLETAAKEQRTACDFTAKAGDCRAQRWWSLQRAKTDLLLALVNGQSEFSAVLQPIVDIADNAAQAQEPETISDALLLLSDYHLMRGSDHDALAVIRRGLKAARRIGNSQALARFGVRLLLLASDDIEADGIKDGIGQSAAPLEKLLSPLRSGARSDPLFAIPESQIAALRRFLASPTTYSRDLGNRVRTRSGWKAVLSKVFPNIT